MNVIDHMRERPEEERFAFAAIAAGVVALILFLMWGLIFFRTNAPVAQAQQQAQTANATEGLKGVQNEISNSVNEFSVQYQQLERALKEVGAASEVQGKNTVDLSVDKNGDVQVDNIIVTEEELDTQR